MPVNIPSRDFDDITSDYKKYLISNSRFKNFNRTSTIKLIGDANAFEMDTMYNFQKNQFQNAYLSTSKGIYLDEFAYLFSINRNTPQLAADLTNTNFRFFIDPIYGKTSNLLLEEFYSPEEIQSLINNGYSNDGTDIVIPKGIRITNLDGTVAYKTNEIITITRTLNEGYTSIIAESAGTTYNVPAGILIRHNLNEIPELRKIANILLCENKFGISNGEGYEDDENLRWRISNKTLSNANANITAIRIAAQNVPGVRSVTILPKAYGTGTFRVFVESINPIITNGLLTAVREAINSVAATGESVTVDHPNYVGIEIQIQLLFDYNANRNLLKEAVRTTLIDYINNLDIGGEIVINEMIQRIMNISTQIKDLNFILFGYGEYNKDTEVNENFIPLRLTNQNAKWNEKFYTNNRLCSICEFGAST